MQKIIYFAGGCFWGVEKYFASVQGVLQTGVGYANGNTRNPSYEQVCHCDTGHAEAVKVVYDAGVVDLDFLLDLFFEIIDPTSVNRQGNDVGSQYRTGIYYVDESDREVIRQSLERLGLEYGRPLAVEAGPLKNYCPAEEYHQKYLHKNPGGYCHIGRGAFELAQRAKPAKYRKKSREELQADLSSLEFQVTQNNATEPPFQNKYCDNDRPGIYVDITTGQPLFLSSDKFESGCGWPSFSRPIDDSLLTERADQSHGMQRTEVRSSLGDSHLGHVFEDGPGELGGMRYCINSASLRFIPKEEMEDQGYGTYLPLVLPGSENSGSPPSKRYYGKDKK